MASDSSAQIKVGDMIDRGVLALNDGYSVRNVELGPVGIPFVRGGDINGGGINTTVEDHIRPEFTGRVQSKLTQPYDVAFITKETVGRVGMIRPGQPQSVFAPQVCYWRSLDRSKLDPRFLFYLRTSAEFQSNFHAVKSHGSMAADYVSMSDQKDFKLTIPPILDQRAIAHILGTLDDKIELNRRMNSTLEAMARALFQSWFVDFDPARRNAEGETGRPEDAMFPDSFEDSELGAIPAGWRAVTLGEFSKNFSKTFDFKRTPEVIFVNTGDVLEGDFLHSNRTSHSGLPGQAKKSIRPDDILFSEIRPANKRYAYVDFDSCDYVVPTKFMIIHASDEIHPRLLYRILTANETLAEFQLQAESRSGTFPQITFDSISHLPIVLPPMEIQNAFQRAVERIGARIKLNKEESRTLANLRDTLLPKLLSGELNS